MKKIIKNISLLVAGICFTGLMASAQTDAARKNSSPKNSNMNTYVIEREIPDAGKFTAEQLKSISQKSCSVLKELGPDIEWVHSYVTATRSTAFTKPKMKTSSGSTLKKEGSRPMW